MKKKVTIKWARELCDICLCVPENAVKYLLMNWEPVGFNCGIYGWNFDVYQVHGIAICSGYRYMPGSISKQERELVALFNTKAQKVWQSALPYADAQAEVENLVDEFVTAIKAGRA